MAEMTMMARMAGLADRIDRVGVYTLGFFALLALALATLGLWVTLVNEIRDERRDYFDLGTYRSALGA